jgi:hypothetical protein
MKVRTSPPGAAHAPLFGLGRSLVRFEGEGDPKPAGAPAPAPAPAAPQPFAVFENSDAFNKRMEREAKKLLRDAGLPDDTASVKAQLDELAKLKAAQEEERKKQMTEADRLREERSQFEAQAKGAMSRAEEAELRAHLYQVFAEKGIKNFDYAFWAVTNKLSSLGETEELDERAFLDELLASQGAALGVVSAAAPTAPTQRPLTNTDPAKGPVAPPAGGTPPPPADAFAQTKDQFNSDLQKRFGFTPMTG